MTLVSDGGWDTWWFLMGMCLPAFRKMDLGSWTKFSWKLRGIKVCSKSSPNFGMESWNLAQMVWIEHLYAKIFERMAKLDLGHDHWNWKRGLESWKSLKPHGSCELRRRLGEKKGRQSNTYPYLYTSNKNVSPLLPHPTHACRRPIRFHRSICMLMFSLRWDRV